MVLHFVTLSAEILQWFVLDAASGPSWRSCSILLQLFLIVLLLFLTIRNSFKKKKKLKCHYHKSVSWPHRTADGLMLKASLKRLHGEWLQLLTQHMRQTRSRWIRVVSEREEKGDINRQKTGFLEKWNDSTWNCNGRPIHSSAKIHRRLEWTLTYWFLCSWHSYSLPVFTTPQGANIYLECSFTGMSTDSWKLKVSCSDTESREAAGGSSYAWSKTSPGVLFFPCTVGELTSNTRGCTAAHTPRRPCLLLPFTWLGV